MTNIKVGDEVIYSGGSRYVGIHGDLTTGTIGIVTRIPDFNDRMFYSIAFVGFGSHDLYVKDFRLKNDPETDRFCAALDMVEAKTGSPGLTSWSDGKVGMALSEFERLAGLLPTVKTGPFEKGETVYFLGYKEPVVIEKFSRGDTVTIQTDSEIGNTLGGNVTSEDGSRQWVLWSEISRTKP